MPKARRKASQRPASRLGAQDKRLQREVAALDFQPIDHAKVLELLTGDTFQELCISARSAAAVLGLSKPKMVAVAKSSGVDKWIWMLDEIGTARKALVEVCKILEMAEIRGIVAAGVMAEEHSRPAAQ